ncbi:MAG: hypothetical protein E6J20_20480 [Chloroflexi bacterium]|nr:MAG: hypothetical protein E6J20_20480 [Chloroflexota bacterium]
MRTVRGANGQDQIEVKDPSDPSGLTWVAVGGTVSNPDENQIKAIRRQILEGQRNERQANEAAGKGYLTNDQVAKIEQEGKTSAAAAQNSQSEKSRLAQAAHDAEVSAGLRQQEINNQSADLGIREKAQQAQIDAQHAANDLAQKRLDLDKIVQDDSSKRDWAKLQYEQEWNAVKAKADNARLLFDQSTEQDRTAQAAQTDSTNRRGQDLNQQQHLDQQALTAGNDILTAAQRGGDTGAKILGDRATNARDTLNQTLGLVKGEKNFGLGGALPAGFGSQLLGGIDQWTTQMAGGADVLKQAQDLIHNANPTLAGTPAGAAWSAVLSQMMGAKQQTDAAAAAKFSGQTTPDQYQPGGDVQPGDAQTGDPQTGDPQQPDFATESINDPSRGPNVHLHFYAPTGGTA